MTFRTSHITAVAAALLLAACNANTPQPTANAAPSFSGDRLAASGVSAPGFQLPDGAGCSGAVARWRALQDNDLRTGHVTQSVYDRIKGEIDAAAAVCAAGQDAQAQGMVRASRLRHGYPAS